MSTKYQMWLTYNAEKEKIQLPVLPESFEVNNGSNNESFFPATKFPGLQVSKITKPLTLVQKINTWKASKKPVHLIVTACGVDVYATIEEFTYSEEGGDPGTYQYSIKLKEYREITVRQVKVNIPKETYTVKSGDCLWNIAKKFYGNGAQYTKIYNANKGVIGGNPNLIYPGQVLTIP